MKMVKRRAARLAPDLGQSLSETGASRRSGVRGLLSRPQEPLRRPRPRAVATMKATAQTVAVDRDQPHVGERIEEMAGERRGNAKPRIIMIQTAVAAAARRRGSTLVASIARTEVPAATSADADQQRTTAPRPSTPSGRELAASAVPSAAPDSAQRERRHSADDPRRSASADVRPIAPGAAAESEWRNARRPQRAWNASLAAPAPPPSRD